ncbi:hypothetical protein HYN69_06685 [Gemmobacter aquarius]|uniref:Uncharacterized protein n=2 Tax=Paragemmobacter aquarius TaxID=2169400 RepID=A0A2S0UKA5_9RHOB|nr:hypothetical protein HYN69_06685 [Gemmobacter aquarius]
MLARRVTPGSEPKMAKDTACTEQAGTLIRNLLEDARRDMPILAPHDLGGVSDIAGSGLSFDEERHA